MKKLPIGIQNFREIIEGGYLYIDKTEQIFRILSGGKYYFLSRPRRFGKSLLVHTIAEIFSGSKELFQGLWIADKWDWSRKNPIILISFNELNYKEVGLDKALDLHLDYLASLFSISYQSSGYSLKFRELIQKIFQKQGKVVLLIDEYDKPIIDYLGNDIEKAKENQEILKNFYSIVKPNDQNLEFAFLTGVSKFSHTSIFSVLNNLRDITLSPSFTTLCGYTQPELEEYFDKRIMDACKRVEMERNEYLNEIKTWYNGYSWDGQNYVYNPFSVLNYFSDLQFQNYWFNTGTPTFLISLLKERMAYDFNGVAVGLSAFSSYDIENIDTYALLFQTGYLTIKGIDELGIYTLDYPNKEVKASMLEYLIGAFSYGQNTQSMPAVAQMQKALMKNEVSKVISIINNQFKNIPSHIFLKEKEAYYHSLIHLMFTFLGQIIDSEVNTSDGRMDAVVRTDTNIYIFEFKLDKSAEEGLQQIIAKGYAEKYKSTGKKIMGVGVNFSSALKKIDDWKLLEILDDTHLSVN